MFKKNARNALGTRAAYAAKQLKCTFFDLCSAVWAQVSFRNSLISAMCHMRWYNFLMNYCVFDLCTNCTPTAAAALQPEPQLSTIDRNDVVRFSSSPNEKCISILCRILCTLCGMTLVDLWRDVGIFAAHRYDMMHVSIMKKELKLTGMEVIS